MDAMNYDDERNLINEVKRIDRRARLYKLSDDGASEQATRRRDRKNNKALKEDPLEYYKRLLEILEMRQAGETHRAPATSKYADHLKRGYEKMIRAIESGSYAEKPAVRVVAPISRRVRREDRRRNKLEKRRK